MCNNNEFYFCEHCGNLIEMIHDAGVSVMCCGQKMKRIEPGVVEASQEKHLPVVSVDGNNVTVNVGSVEHPMNREHFIEWVCLETEHGIQYAHLDPEDKPRAKFSICDGDEVRAVYAFCNQHDLWRESSCQ